MSSFYIINKREGGKCDLLSVCYYRSKFVQNDWVSYIAFTFHSTHLSSFVLTFIVHFKGRNFYKEIKNVVQKKIQVFCFVQLLSIKKY